MSASDERTAALSPRTNDKNPYHGNHANRLDKIKREANARDGICLLHEQVNETLTYPRKEYHDRQSVWDWTGDRGGKQGHDDRRVDRKVLDAIHVSPDGPAIPLGPLHLVGAPRGDRRAAGQDAAPAINSDRCKQDKQCPSGETE